MLTPPLLPISVIFHYFCPALMKFALDLHVKRWVWPGWDKIFYFVGANTFSQKFHPKQRESDATEGVQNSGNLGIRYVVYKFISSELYILKCKFCFLVF